MEKRNNADSCVRARRFRDKRHFVQYVRKETPVTNVENMRQTESDQLDSNNY